MAASSPLSASSTLALGRDSRSTGITNNSDSDSGSDNDETILRPRGRFAARMLAESNNESQYQASETESTTDKAAGTNNSRDDEDEDDIVPVARARKMKPRRQRSSTPEEAPQQDAPSSRFESPQRSKSTPAPDSSSLFVSPSKSCSPTTQGNAQESDASDDEDLPSPSNLAKKPRFLALVARKREERLAREAEEARKKADRLAAQQAAAQDDDDILSVDEDSSVTDDEGGRKLTQTAARPTARKASKKALEEMHRETQRLTRSLQLAHEAKVKKKITKTALFERFNFKPEGAATPAVEQQQALPSSSRPASPSSVHQTDAEMKDADTPPSSPPLEGTDAAKGQAQGNSQTATAPQNTDMPFLEEDEDGELPSLEAALESAAAARRRLEKGKGKATAAELEAEQQPKEILRAKRNIRIKLPAQQVNVVSLDLDDDDDDELEVRPARKSKIDAIFDSIPVNQARESRSMQMLRRLAHVDDPEKKATTASIGKHAKTAHQQPAMTVSELQVSLLQRARQQAKLERDSHLDLLRSKGIHVQTAEEREKQIAEVEDIVARARKEAEDIMKREREAAKEDRKVRKAAGELDPLGWDDSDDEYTDADETGSEGEGDAAAEVELSGSEEEDVLEDEDDDEAEDEEEDAEVDPVGGLFDDAAESAEESEAEDVEQELDAQDSDGETASSKQAARRRPRKHVTILSDDDDDEVEGDAEKSHLVEATPRPKAKYPKSPSAAPNTVSPHVPTSVLRSATKTFIPGLPVAGAAGLGLTQIFAGTMDDSQSAPGSVMGSPSQPRPTFGGVEEFPDSNFSQTAQEASDDMILDSQPARRAETQTQDPDTQGVQIRFSQSQVHGFDSLLQDNHDLTQLSELEPTQDGGFHNFTPLKQRFVEPPASTIDTVKMGQTQAEAEVEHESPLVRRTGKLRRRGDVAAAAAAVDSDPEDEMEGVEADEFGFGTVESKTAFALMKEAARREKAPKLAEAFDKKKSKARDMVEDQAEESEDEYAGIGGVDGEYSSDDDDHSVKEMIDDETKNNAGDERKLAAFYADRERASDEKQVDKLFHDITTGMLRRKRGGDWDDLEDEDDGGEARRRLKRRQFAKMQRALFADERISKVAENPRNQAFLRTIEDRGSDDDMDFIFAPTPAVAAELDSQEDSQTPATTTIIPNSQPPMQTAAGSRPPASLRRTKDGKKPSNIGDIRESLSNLLDEPSLHSSSVIPATDLRSDDDTSEDEQPQQPATTTATSPSRRPGSSGSGSSSNKENCNPNPRRRRGGNTNSNREAIVDRISLKRNASSSVTGRAAFATANGSTSASGAGVFKVPALLRRATTNSLMSSTSTSSSTSTTNNTATTAAKNNSGGSGFGEDAKIKRTAGKRSGINFFARETERRAALAESDRRREARKWKGAEGRGKALQGAGVFGAGTFE
ncbi:MRC1-like domain-containing protein [Lasiosphaeria miniovina]|uniref:MRC1-like domain-containing protein n=1 Tax=Lasiosphaeria miniovina TaxID=1954250 RepID=A0AA40B3E7_9PEZI|nr:MRC1-like domain-containing protein [Lasiosphaeria miniovina]KAK0726959.1 MRC1-like domain-containing protein [Lasiosphaeria miniovina]